MNQAKLAAAAPGLLAALQQAERSLPAGPVRDRAAAAIQAALGEVPPPDPAAPTLEALIHGTRAQIELACAAIGITKPEYCITGENGVTFMMSSGPVLLEAVARVLNIDPDRMARWEDLTEADRLDWGSAAAGNLQWAIDGQPLDSFGLELIVQQNPGILQRLTAPRRRPELGEEAG